MQVKDIAAAIETFAPLSYQEDYDNSGLQVGDPDMPVTGVLISLDVTEEILKEAEIRGCNMIVSHHPLIFSKLKRVTGSNYVEKIVRDALKKDIALYAAHTNLDHVKGGVNAKIAERLGLEEIAVLDPMKNTLYKLQVYVPADAADALRDALFSAGAGALGKYQECSFNIAGEGTFRPGSGADPYIGQAGGARETVREIKIEVLIVKNKISLVLEALHRHHPYEEVAYELIAIENRNPDLGAGMIGVLPEPVDAPGFLAFLKESMQTGCIRYTPLPGRMIRKVAVCGGSGSFLLPQAIRSGADVFITGDYKYHQFFDAGGRIMIADIGHYESEQFTASLLADIIKEKKPNFAVLLSNLSTNPIKYYC